MFVKHSFEHVDDESGDLFNIDLTLNIFYEDGIIHTNVASYPRIEDETGSLLDKESDMYKHLVETLLYKDYSDVAERYC